ncbi:hypothetical protein Pmar_PMAR016519 [Perkinsus marinus ATCC 50983]|uniref:Uncharacterized protein n=1 Tax=Perkinsus marinus (strain ATCC 50983 / TXsc) TaxID=423536 RepID=C5KEU8_PERM5|nr:hypothetical protein Pmar_PMAR016519 [Perkinsus marinus ATCC 50983]EER16989.1 hypothetical protein Pmar_PMAR016519 [Perkinsus marinus ATCC 50983]|eukprot:XP_002785193.1 hypothetical protein Pmar_PMAR016519 [Perkinsus marinus ATCC 50983]
MEMTRGNIGMLINRLQTIVIMKRNEIRGRSQKDDDDGAVVDRHHHHLITVNDVKLAEGRIIRGPLEIDNVRMGNNSKEDSNLEGSSSMVKKRKSVHIEDGIMESSSLPHLPNTSLLPPLPNNTKRARIDIRQWLGASSSSDLIADEEEKEGDCVANTLLRDESEFQDGSNNSSSTISDSRLFEFNFNEGHTNAVKKIVYVRDLILSSSPFSIAPEVHHE